MKRELSMGDLIIVVGGFICLISMIVLSGFYLWNAKFNLISLGLLMMCFISLTPFVIVYFSMTKEEFLRFHYLYPLFILFLKFADVGIFSNVAYAQTVKKGTQIYGVDFFIIIGVLFICAGTYIAQMQSIRYKPVVGPEESDETFVPEQTDNDKEEK